MSVETPVETPPETPAPADPVAPAPETPPAADQPTDAAKEAQAALDRDDKGRFRNPVQPRIDELTRKARESEREAAWWKARAEALEKPPEKPPEKPTPEKYDDYGAYVEALADWKADEKVKAALAERDKAAAETKQTETRQSTWQQRKAEAAKTIPDIDAVLSASEVPLSADVQAELLDSEFGPQIAYHLDKHPEIAEKLNGMTDKQVAREIGRLEATMGTAAPAPVVEGETTPDPEPAPVVTKKTTSAPPPVKPIGQGRSTQVDLSKASMDDYVAARKAQGASWARR
jgi:hypothetical protein